MRRLLASALCAGVVAAVPAPAQAWDEGEYWGFADRLQKRLDDSWNTRLDRYNAGSPSVDTMLNANELLIHSAAALRGLDPSHPARADARARSIALQLTQTPPWIETVTDPLPGSQPHSPGWVGSMHRSAPASTWWSTARSPTGSRWRTRRATRSGSTTTRGS